MSKVNQFVCYNGRFVHRDKLVIPWNNRGFKYADGFFETMHYAFGGIQLYDYHVERWQNAMQFLKLENELLSHPTLLLKDIAHLVNANHHFKGSRIRMSIFREGEGFYTPSSQKASFIIESSVLESDSYPLNKQGLSIEVFDEHCKNEQNPNFYKSLHATTSILAGIQKQEWGVDDCMLQNSKNQIIESISSNIFFIQGQNIITPHQHSGCLQGVFRRKVIDFLPQLGYKVEQNQAVKVVDLPHFDEIFLTNAIQGIQWVGAFRNKRYDNKQTKLIQQALVTDIIQSTQ